MQFTWFLGMPGAGKSELSKRFSEMTGVPAFDGDDFQTDADRRLIEKRKFTQVHRYAQLGRIINHLKHVGRVILSHPLPNPESRKWAVDHGGTLVYVRAPILLIKRRLESEDRKDHPFRPEMLEDWIPRHWVEPVKEGCFVIDNGYDNRAVNERLEVLRSIT